MFKDIKVFKDNESIKYNYKIDDKQLIFSIDNIGNSKYDNLEIIYDENIYQIDLNNNIKSEN